MKRSQLNKIIREEYQRILFEAFGDPIASKLQRLGGVDTRYKKFWNAAANTYDIAWDKLPKGSFRKITNTAEAKKGMTFFVITSRKPNPFNTDNYGFDAELQPGVLSVTVDGKPQYFQQSGGTRYTRGIDKIGSKLSARATQTGDPIGRGQRGIFMFKKLIEVADIMYNFDLEAFRGGTTALKADRVELQSGADKFSDPKAWKKANIARYQKILADRVGSRGAVDRMVAEIIKIGNEAVTKGMELPKLGKYDEIVTDINGNEVTLNTITRRMNDTIRNYSRFIQSENEMASHLKDYPEYDMEDSFQKGNQRSIALEIKQELAAFKSGRIR